MLARMSSADLIHRNGLGACVVLVDEGCNRLVQGGDAAVDAAAQLLFGQQGEEPLDLVEPGRTGGRQMHVPARPARQPSADAAFCGWRNCPSPDGRPGRVARWLRCGRGSGGTQSHDVGAQDRRFHRPQSWSSVRPPQTGRGNSQENAHEQWCHDDPLLRHRPARSTQGGSRVVARTGALHRRRRHPPSASRCHGAQSPTLTAISAGSTRRSAPPCQASAQSTRRQTWRLTERSPPVAKRYPTATVQPFQPPPRLALPQDRVRYVGEVIACVVAETRWQAKDAAEAVVVDIEQLPAVTDCAAAVAPGAVQLHDSCPGNVVIDFQFGDSAVVATAFGKAAHVVKQRILSNRVVVNPMETRAAVAIHDPAAGHWTLHTPSQGVFGMRQSLAPRSEDAAGDDQSTHRQCWRLVWHEGANLPGADLHPACRPRPG